LLYTFESDKTLYLLNDPTKELPGVLFLDLNMPRKNGFDCLLEIKASEKLKRLPVVIFSTSSDPAIVSLLFKNGAQHYIRKPNNFKHLKNLIYQALILTEDLPVVIPEREHFVLS
jgi:FixJ family two-component response regulator